MPPRSALFLGLALAIAAGGERAALAAAAPQFHGLDVRLDYAHVHKSPFYEGPRVAPSASGINLRLSYALSPRFAPYAGATLAPHDWGSQTAIYYSGGLCARFSWTRHLMPFGSGGLGYLRDPARQLGYTFAEVGGGVEAFVSGRLAVHPALEFIFPVGSADALHPLPGDPAPSLDAAQERISFGLTWFMGKRAG